MSDHDEAGLAAQSSQAGHHAREPAADTTSDHDARDPAADKASDHDARDPAADGGRGQEVQGLAPGADQGAAGDEVTEPARKRLGRAFGKAAARSPRMSAFAQRAQESAQRTREAAQDKLAAARKNQTVDRALEAGRTAREAARPKLTHARQGVQQKISDNPEVAAKVARSLTIAVMRLAASQPGADPAIKTQAPVLGDHVGKAVTKLISRSRRGSDREGAAELTAGPEPGTAQTASDTTPDASGASPAASDTTPDASARAGERQADPAAASPRPGGEGSEAAAGPAQADPAATSPRPAGEESEAAAGPAQAAIPGESAQAAIPGEPAQTAIPGAMVPGEGAEGTDLAALAESLGVRTPPDPAALYRDGPGEFELLFPLPEELASLPWGSLSRRNRFYLLVAAWARREADGIHALRAGQLDEAAEVFQECLIRAEQIRTPELVYRSYEDLAELATATGDEATAAQWRAAAAQVAGR